MPQNDFSLLYRAKVIDNNDPDDYGRVKVYIPQLMILSPDDGKTGIWAWPANNPLGGIDPKSDTTHYQGSFLIPHINSWVWVFFEQADPSRPFYLGGIQLNQAKVISEGRVGNNKTSKYVLYKTKLGRVIILSDDDYDERVEITGKKRKLSDPPSGDTRSVYEIRDNQTTILIDEREGKEKILISDYKGNYICIHTENEQFHLHCKSDIIIDNEDGDISIQSNKGLIQIVAKDNKINISAKDDIYLQSDNNIVLAAKNNIQIQASNELDVMGNKVQIQSLEQPMFISSSQNININSQTLVAIDGLNSGLALNDGASQPAQIEPQTPDSPKNKKPDGDRDS